MKKILLLAALCLSALHAHAQVIQAKGVGTLSYAGGLTQDVKDQAYVKAQLAAVERYFAESGESESQNFDSIEGKVAENLDKFIFNTAILNEQDQASVHKYSIAVRIDLNVARLRTALRGASNTGKAGSAAKSQLVYLFVGREAASVRSFDARVLKRVEAEADASGTARGAQRATAQVETGGSSTQKADDTVYRLLPIANVGTAISSLFSQGGFVMVDPAYVISDRDFKSINKDFSTGNDLQPATQRAIVATLKKAQVPLLVIATLDAGPPSPDPATGMVRVSVGVTGRVLDLSNGLPREVASVPLTQWYGVAPDNATARDQGLKKAAEAAAREVISRLNAAGIQ
ncbi:hypothetical protein [Rugamonas sp.]|uniref:hypothetical protein n=1 Tax=Rugamonas sp. TaxID=1926287 RepID=UPI0025D87EE2|nr:hypothetical protein [Rugamonas sp.]